MARRRSALWVATIVAAVALTAPATPPVAASQPGAMAPSLRITPSSSQVRVGETVAFVTEIDNPTAIDLVGLRVASEPVDDTTSLLGARTDRGVFDPVTSTWFVDLLPAGTTATLEVFARAETTGTARIVLIAAIGEPSTTLVAADAELEISGWQATDGQGTHPAFLAALLVVLGGLLVSIAGLTHLRQRTVRASR